MVCILWENLYLWANEMEIIMKFLNQAHKANYEGAMAYLAKPHKVNVKEEIARHARMHEEYEARLREKAAQKRDA